MAIKDKVEERLLDVRDMFRERQARLEEAQKAIQERLNELRASWKQEVYRKVDEVFCLVMETLERTLSHLHAGTLDVNGLKYGFEEQPIITSNDWVQ